MIAGSQPHPGELVESAAMASVDPIDATYVPNLSQDMVKGKVKTDATEQPVKPVTIKSIKVTES